MQRYNAKVLHDNFDRQLKKLKLLKRNIQFFLYLNSFLKFYIYRIII